MLYVSPCGTSRTWIGVLHFKVVVIVLRVIHFESSLMVTYILQMNLSCKFKRKCESTCIAQLDLILKALKLCSVLNGITQFYLPPHILYPTGQSKTWKIISATNYLMLLLILPTLKGWKPESSYPSGSGVEPLNCMNEHALESVR